MGALMRTNDQRRAEIDAIIADIKRLQHSLGFDARQPSDREAYDIVVRIQRRLRAYVSHETQGAAE